MWSSQFLQRIRYHSGSVLRARVRNRLANATSGTGHQSNTVNKVDFHGFLSRKPRIVMALLQAVEQDFLIGLPGEI